MCGESRMRAIGDWVVIKVEESKSDSGLITQESNEGRVVSCCCDDTIVNKMVAFDLHRHRRYKEFYLVEYTNIFGVIN